MLRGLIEANAFRQGRKQARKAPVIARSALIIPPAGTGSFGDAAMMVATRDALRSRGFEYVGLALPEPWEAIAGFDEIVDDGGYFYRNNVRALPRLLAAVRKYELVVMVGADVIDGVYNPASVARRLGLLREHARLGRQARVLGSSFSETPQPRSIEVLRRLPRAIDVLARDAVSQDRMQRALQRDIPLVADLAFLLRPVGEAEEARSARAWVNERRAAGDRIVAVNLNYLIENKHPGFSSAMNAIASKLVDQKISLMLVPHDIRTENSDLVMLRRLAAFVGNEQSARIHLVDPKTPGGVKAALAECDLVVTGRMHVAILAFGAGRSCLSFGYQGKFEGLYGSLGLDKDDLLLDPQVAIDNPEAVLSYVERALRLAADHRNRVSNGLPSIMKKAELNFAGISR